ncbi:hypothetical protein BBJ28_00020135 [Nothophytophthora sp. Chile5]|nr:hypothetical protein BBJ28_00020135 [Nothophytophthora sp. Chile5]
MEATRKLVCVTPGDGAFTVEMKGADDVDALKRAIRVKKPKLFNDDDVHVFPLLLEDHSDDVLRLVQGDANARVRELMSKREISLLASVDKVFGDALREGVVHVLATAPGWSSTRTLACVVPGADVFTVEVKGADDVDALKRAIRVKKPKLFNDDDVHVFPLLLEDRSEDVRLLKRGDVSMIMRARMAKGEINLLASMDKVFGDAPREGVVHVLAINPARPPRPALSNVLGKRARPHWDVLNDQLKNLRSAKSKTTPLSKISWKAIQSNYYEEMYTQEPKPVSSEIAQAVWSEVEKSIKAIKGPRTEMETTCVLFTLFRDIFLHCEPKVRMNLQAQLQSFNDVLQASGFADFVFSRKRAKVCVMEAKKIKKEDEDENEEKNNGGDEDDVIEEQTMADGFAQALIGMELQNTYRKNPSQTVSGIVSNYTSWTFIRMEYPEGEDALPIVSRDDDRLVENIREKPSDENLARILGKIMAMVDVVIHRL